MRRRLLTIWYILLILSVVELLAYWLSGFIANGYRNMAWDRFNEKAQIVQDVEPKTPYAEIINRYAREAGINAQVIASVIQVESSFQPRAVSSAGAYGLMQIIPDTWRHVNKEIRACAGRHNGECSSECYYNAEINIHIGTAYLEQLLKRYKGNMVLALAAYNAGPGAVDSYKGIPPYAETVKYTESVISHCYSLENKGMLSTVATSKHWDKVHTTIGWSLIFTSLAVVWVVRRLFRYRRSWRWR